MKLKATPVKQTVAELIALLESFPPHYEVNVTWEGTCHFLTEPTLVPTQNLVVFDVENEQQYRYEEVKE